MKELANTILEGEPYNKTFIHSVPMLDKEMFFKAGRMVVWSILHGGPGFPFLNPTIYQILLEPEDAVHCIDDVIDLDVKNKIHKVYMFYFIYINLKQNKKPVTGDSKFIELTCIDARSIVYYTVQNLKIHTNSKMYSIITAANCRGGRTKSFDRLVGRAWSVWNHSTIHRT